MKEREGEEGEETLTDVEEREGFTDGYGDGWGGFPEEESEGEEGEEGEGGFADGWGGFPGEGESFTDKKSLQESRESPQNQFCSSCTKKKPFTDFDGFFTCNPCRERNKRAVKIRQVKQKEYKVSCVRKVLVKKVKGVIQARARFTGDYLFRGNFTWPVNIKDYLENKTS